MSNVDTKTFKQHIEGVDSVKHISIGESESISGSNGAGFKFDLMKKFTDIGANEKIEDFIIRHGGLDQTLEYIAGCTMNES